jgi:hypothetical protein
MKPHAAMAGSITGVDADGVERVWKPGDRVVLVTPDCPQIHNLPATVRHGYIRDELNMPWAPNRRVPAVTLMEFSNANTCDLRKA